MAPTFSVHAAGSITYRWVDAEGNLQLSDTLPSGAASNGYQVIDPHTGTVVREVDPRKTAEEKAREAAERQAAEKAAREAQAQAERDHMLLSLYSNEADLRQVRDKRLEQMDSRITQMEGSIKRMQANIDTGHDDRAYTQKLEQLKKAVTQAQAERKAVAERFEADLERLRQLRSNG
jgi:chromosome segregation ATPase